MLLHKYLNKEYLNYIHNVWDYGYSKDYIITTLIPAPTGTQMYHYESLALLIPSSQLEFNRVEVPYETRMLQ